MYGRLCVVLQMQAACVKYSQFLLHLVSSDLITLSELQAGFHDLLNMLPDMKQVVHFWCQCDSRRVDMFESCMCRNSEYIDWLNENGLYVYTVNIENV